MATLGGAEALGLGQVTGSLSPGKKADLLIVDTSDVNIAPMVHPESTVLQSATPANVELVMVDGRILKKEKRLLEMDVSKIVAAAARSAHRIRKAAGGRLALSGGTHHC